MQFWLFTLQTQHQLSRFSMTKKKRCFIDVLYKHWFSMNNFGRNKLLWNFHKAIYFVSNFLHVNLRFQSIFYKNNKKKNHLHKIGQQRKKTSECSNLKKKRKIRWKFTNFFFISRPFLHGLPSSQRRYLMVAVLSCCSDLVIFAQTTNELLQMENSKQGWDNNWPDTQIYSTLGFFHNGKNRYSIFRIGWIWYFVIKFNQSQQLKVKLIPSMVGMNWSKNYIIMWWKSNKFIWQTSRTNADRALMYTRLTVCARMKERNHNQQFWRMECRGEMNHSILFNITCFTANNEYICLIDAFHSEYACLSKNSGSFSPDVVRIINRHKS